MNLIYSILAAFSMFSALPMPQVPWEKEKIRYMLVALPLVGAVVGIAEYLWLRLCSRLAFGLVPGGFSEINPPRVFSASYSSRFSFG